MEGQLKAGAFNREALLAAQVVYELGLESRRMNKLQAVALVLCNGDFGYNPDKISEMRNFDDLVTVLQTKYPAERYAAYIDSFRKDIGARSSRIETIHSRIINP